MTILSKIVKRVRERVEQEKRLHPINEGLRNSSKSNNFLESIKNHSETPVIGELKKSSPSAGEVRSDFDVFELSRSIEEGGAVAISVLTEPQFFDGSLDYLEKVREAVNIPILRKDFIVDEYQLYRTADMGADAVLLIAEVLGDELSEFVKLSYDLGIEPLVEVSNREQAEHVDSVECDLVGINNRDLKTMNVDLSRTEKIIDSISKNSIVVSESGIRDRIDIEKVRKMGADVALVGSAIMESNNVKEKVEKLVSGVYND